MESIDDKVLIKFKKAGMGSLFLPKIFLLTARAGKVATRQIDKARIMPTGGLELHALGASGINHRH